MAATLAGRVAAGYAEHRIVPPSDDEISHFLAKVREGTDGRCDECQVAKLLRLLYPDDNDAEIAQRWREHFRRTADLFDDVMVRCAVRRLARELQAKIRIDREEIESLIGHLMPRSEA